MRTGSTCRKGPRQIKLAGQEKGKVQKGLKEAGSADPGAPPNPHTTSFHLVVPQTQAVSAPRAAALAGPALVGGWWFGEPRTTFVTSAGSLRSSMPPRPGSCLLQRRVSAALAVRQVQRRCHNMQTQGPPCARICGWTRWVGGCRAPPQYSPIESPVLSPAAMRAEPAPSGAGASRHYATEENPEDTEDSGDSSSSGPALDCRV